MFSGPKLARESGDKLGKVFIEASQHTRKVKNPSLGFATGVAHVPYGPLPSIEQLEKDKQDLLAILVNQATVAVRNAQLYKQVEIPGFLRPFADRRAGFPARPR